MQTVTRPMTSRFQTTLFYLLTPLNVKFLNTDKLVSSFSSTVFTFVGFDENKTLKYFNNHNQLPAIFVLPYDHTKVRLKYSYSPNMLSLISGLFYVTIITWHYFRDGNYDYVTIFQGWWLWSRDIISGMVIMITWHYFRDGNYDHVT